MDAFLLAVASGLPMRHDTPRQPKTASSLPKPSQNLPSRPPVPISKQPQSWATTAAAAPPVTNSPTHAPFPASLKAKHSLSYTPVSKQPATTSGHKAIFRLSEDAPLLKADITSVKAAFIQIVPALKDGIDSVSRSSNGFYITFSSDTSRKLALDNADSIKASLSGSLV